MGDINDWPMPPQVQNVATGQLIRYRRTTSGGHRVGGAEPKVIVAETREFVVYRVWSADGRDLAEYGMRKDRFEELFERGPMVQYVDSGRSE